MIAGNLAPALESLPAAWRARAAELRIYGAESPAVAWERAADELERVVAAAADQLLPLEEASQASGYSTDHLRRLVRQGALGCTRRGRRLYFRAADLPRRPVAVDAADLGGYDPAADARRVAGMRAHGG
jgi:hypothetical protein